LGSTLIVDGANEATSLTAIIFGGFVGLISKRPGLFIDKVVVIVTYAV
jgi:hypothetical protein